MIPASAKWLVLLLLDSSVRIALIAGGVWLTLAGLRIRSHAVRHAAWTVVLAAMLAMPGLLCLGRALPLPAWTPPAPVHAFASAPARVQMAAPPAFPPEAAPIDAPSGRPPSVLPIDQLSAWWTAAGAIWLMITACFGVRIVLGWKAMRRVLRSARRIDVAGFGPAYESPLAAVPMTAGVFAPKVLLPETWTAWNPEELRGVLAHESAHIRRRDTVTAFVAQAACALFWFHPVAWRLRRALTAEAEHACDAAAIEQVDAAQYAGMLLKFSDAVRQRGRRLAWDSLGVVGSGLLEARIHSIVEGAWNEPASKMRKAVVTVSCAGLIFIGAACRIDPISRSCLWRKCAHRNSRRPSVCRRKRSDFVIRRKGGARKPQSSPAFTIQPKRTHWNPS